MRCSNPFVARQNKCQDCSGEFYSDPQQFSGCATPAGTLLIRGLVRPSAREQQGQQSRWSGRCRSLQTCWWGGSWTGVRS
eukprot:15744_4